MSKSLGVFFLSCLTLACSSASALADEAEVVKLLTERGAKITETKGVVTGVSVPDCRKMTLEDYQKISSLSGLKSLGFGFGPTNEGLAQLKGLPELEVFGSNGMQVSDEGIKPLAQFKKLKTLSFFHPGKDFTGKGLAQLAELPNLEALTVAGSYAVNDEGLAAIAKLTNLKSLRVGHVGATLAGVKSLKALKKLTYLQLGQRLSFKPPACPSNETIAVLAEMTSLESLQLIEARFSLESLSQLKQLPRLKKLSLDLVDMAEADVESLRKQLPQAEIKWTKPNESATRRIVALFGESR
jgi:hypothetical protein